MPVLHYHAAAEYLSIYLFSPMQFVFIDSLWLYVFFCFIKCIVCSHNVRRISYFVLHILIPECKYFNRFLKLNVDGEIKRQSKSEPATFELNVQIFVFSFLHNQFLLLSQLVISFRLGIGFRCGLLISKWNQQKSSSKYCMHRK